MKKGLFKSKLALTVAVLIVLATVACIPLAYAASARGKAFILLQGIDTSLTATEATQNVIPTDVGSFGQRGGIYPALHNQFPSALFLNYSYNATTDGNTQTYDCADTFTHSIKDDILALDREITNASHMHPNTDFYLVGHSLGGVIAFGYLALLETRGWPSLPMGSMLKSVVTLDSPLGGVTDNRFYTDLAQLVYGVPMLSPVAACNQLLARPIENIVLATIAAHLKAVPSVDTMRGLLAAAEAIPTRPFQSISDLQTIFLTTSKPTFPPPDDTMGETQGEHASIVEAILGGPALTNQGLAEEAQQHGIPVLTIANTRDFISNPSACTFGVVPNFINTQWLEDKKIDNINVYSRDFAAGLTSCNLFQLPLGMDVLNNHREVLHTTIVQDGLLQFLPNGDEPVALTVPQLEP